MTRGTARVLAGTLCVFIVTLIAGFPANWARFLLPATVRCRELSGSVWSGQCLSLTVAGVPLGDTEWTLRALPLLRAHLAGSFSATRPDAHASADFDTGPGGRVVLGNLVLHASLGQPLYRNLLSSLASGEVDANLARLELQGRAIRDLRGRIEARDVVARAAPPVALGSYELRFDGPAAANGDVVGLVHDLGGPVAFDGTLRLTPAPGYLLAGRVASRAGADASLERVFALLGRPEADGRRSISQEGTF